MNLNISFLQNQGALLLFKVGFVIILSGVEIFLFVLHKQIRSMNSIVTQPDMFPYLQIFMIILEIATFLLILLTLVIL